MDTNENVPGASLTRRKFLTLAGAGVGAGILTACGTPTAKKTALIRPTDAVIARLEARRRRAGAPVRDITLSAAAATVDLAGRQVETWAYGGKVPGPVIRADVGDVVRLHNPKPGECSAGIHWRDCRSQTSPCRTQRWQVGPHLEIYALGTDLVLRIPG